MNRAWICVCVIVVLAAAYGQTNSIFGNWTNPTGSTIHIYRCGPRVCANVFGISSSAPARVDAKNPNPALRGRSLCGLRIGTGFELVSPGRAQGGTLYDPESGKTYSGSMTREGDKLELRGYVGIPLFGRTETWSHAPEAIAACRS